MSKLPYSPVKGECLVYILSLSLKFIYTLLKAHLDIVAAANRSRKSLLLRKL